MGLDFQDQSQSAKQMIDESNKILGFDLFEVMCKASAEDLQQTKVTQPAIFLYSLLKLQESDQIFEAVAGHSLGEFTALVANGVLSFSDAMRLVRIRANAMQKACEQNPGTMAAILGLEDQVVESVCEQVDGIVVPANYNCPGQLVISGELKAVEQACELATEAGAKRALILPVGGAFHSPLMKPAEDELAAEIETLQFNDAKVPVYQNIVAKAVSDANEIKNNLIKQLTGPVKWHQSILQMKADGFDEYAEIGPGKTLRGLVLKIDRQLSFVS
ncbi:unnamed protein product [Cyprideis torosa]|uniref:[acyl-carrier-protein] S-malonyltransferase n=1 Tax=Cyprideis torosa TaxID=163714 RepID=A0A7R8WJF0_9CRUS|nr:unnamed protein product [Cyprideis torosa]CAG0901915.1 unnamed protein product [Cyprideis torosa]